MIWCNRSLTTGIDTTINGTTGNDTFIGVIGTGATLNAGDSVNAGTGIDTLRISSGSATALATGLAGITLTGFETVSVINPGDVALDGSGLTGVTTLRVEDASGMGGKTITSALGMTNVSLATTGGAVTATGTMTWAANAADTTLNLTLAGYQYVAGGTPTALTVTGAAATTLNITSNTAANKAAAFTAPATITTTVNIAAATALTNTSTAATGATKVNITGAGAVTLGTTDFAATLTIDATGSTGNISLATEATTTLTYKGSTGNDTISFAAGELTSADSIDLGAGSNTLSIADTGLGGSGTAALNTVVNGITSAQTILVTGAATVDMSGVTARILSLGATSNFVVTKLEAADKVVVNGVTAGTVDATAALGFNTLNLELNGGAAAAATGTLNVTSQASINILSATTATTTAGANLIGAVTNTANAVFTVTGANQLTITSLSAAASFDASAATGIITVTGANAASILKGGSKADVLTGATLAGGDTLTGGAGNDTLNTAVTTGTVATVITGGTGADAINLKGVATGNKVITLNTTAAESFATASSFDTVTYSNHTDTTTTTSTLVTGLLSAVLVGATTVTIGTTTITAGGFLAVGSASATLTTTNQSFQIYQDSNSNGIIEATDLRVDFTITGNDTQAITIVGSQLVSTLTGVA